MPVRTLAQVQSSVPKILPARSSDTAILIAIPTAYQIR